jgi:zinc and cadmium transporter
MNAAGYIAVYCALVLLFSMAGGYVPFLGRVSHGRLQLYLSISAGVMLGASFFHVMPEAMEFAGGNFGWWMSLGVVGLFCIERFIAPHSHEVDGTGHHHHHHDEGVTGQISGGSHHEHHGQKAAGHDHEHHTHGPSKTGDHRAAAPSVAGWAAVLGLTIHTFMNGVGLAGSVLAEKNDSSPGILSFLPALPGLAMFLAIVLHKPADALAISTVLTRKGVSRNRIFLVQLLFACMVPIGATTFWLTQGAIETDLRNQLTGAALAFSAGTFLFIALSDLLPEVQFHQHDRGLLFLSLACGVALMGAIALLEGHEHGDHEHGHHATAHSHDADKADHDDDEHSEDHGHHDEHDHSHR